ncbi:hypothetical protein AK812_SmicGene437 [Symbiodinium microadriaticum]|uniref:Uncharacterized protein n=1 Tax=Symbiodinium microadriaticum TaxID=2951 RepID=A0A1Q9F6N8_SYMMI|nr:hypothetical protein AK812_SmicGene437 [Symbiodinium microadriaticum]
MALRWLLATVGVSHATPWQPVAGTGRSGFGGASHRSLVQETVAGTGEDGFADGGAATALFNLPTGLAFDAPNEVLYVADMRNHRIRAVSLSPGLYYQAEENRSSGGFTFDTVRLHGSKAELLCAVSAESSPLMQGSAFCDGSTGSGYAEFVLSFEDRIDFNVEATAGAGTYELRFRYADRYSEVRSPTQRRLRLRVNGVVVTHHLDFRPSARGAGSLSRYAWRSISTALTAGTNLVQLQVTGNWGPRIDLLYVLPPVPSVVTVAGSGAVGLPSPDDLVVAQTASSTSFAAPQGLALDQTSQLLYIAAGCGRSEYMLMMLADSSTGGTETRHSLGNGFESSERTIAGGAINDELTDGVAADSGKLFRPAGLALDTSRGFLYVSDSHHRKVRRIDLGSAPLSGGTITTLSGSGFDMADFEQNQANFLYVADTGHGRLRFVDADPNLACPSEVGPPATLQFCGSQSISQVDCLALGCCFDTVCTSPPNFDGRMTPGFAPEDVLTKVEGIEQTPPISFVSGGTERCCFPNIRVMSTLDVLEAPRGLALDGTNRLLYVSQANSHRVVTADDYFIIARLRLKHTFIGAKLQRRLGKGRLLMTPPGDDELPKVGLHFALGAGKLLHVAPAAVALLQEIWPQVREGLERLRGSRQSDEPPLAHEH